MMKGMILAAGFGSRLGLMTKEQPKALLPVAGKPMIEYVIEALTNAGCRMLVVNAHHHAQRLKGYLQARQYTLPVYVSMEREILGTGGGVRHARELLDGNESILVHNADIITEFDLRRLVAAHAEADPLATLLVQRRETSRAVLFTPDMCFLGKQQWRSEGHGFPENAQAFAFCGVHVLSPRMLHPDSTGDCFDIFDCYRKALASAHVIRGLEHDTYWTDLGTPERIRAYERRVASITGTELNGE